MISDSDLYSLAIFLGCVSMLLIVMYHFLEVNASPDSDTSSSSSDAKDTTYAHANAAKAGTGAANVSGDVVNPSTAGQSVGGADVVAAGVNGAGKKG